MKAIIVEDSVAVRENICALLLAVPGVEVVAQVADEAGAIASINALLPDVVILDLHLQQGSGMNVLLSIKQSHAKGKVIVLSNDAAEPYVSRCRQAGADHFLDKSFQFMLLAGLLEQMMQVVEQENRFNSNGAR